MTEVQKEMIRAMRLQGIGYKAIARDLNLRRNQVQLYCKTHGLGGDGKLVRLNYEIWCEKTGHCLMCGKKLSQPATGRKKRFCSGRCRTAYCRKKRTAGTGVIEELMEVENEEDGWAGRQDK